MIEVLATDKISEGMLYKNSQVRYTWWIKVNSTPHIIELVIGTLGKKQVILDQKEIYNSRSVLSNTFHYKVIIDDKVFTIKNDKDDYEVYADENCTITFTNLLEKNKKSKIQSEQPVFQSILPDIHQFSNKTDHYANTTQNKSKAPVKEMDLLDVNSENLSNNKKAKNKLNNFNFDAPAKKNTSQTQGRLFDELGTDFFDKNTKDENKLESFNQFESNPFETNTQDNPKSDDWTFKNSNTDNNQHTKKSNVKIFDDVPISKSKNNKLIDNNLFEEVNDAFKNAKLIEDNGNYAVSHDENPDNNNFDVMDDFDKQLEQNKKSNKTYLRSPFDIDPEEGMHYIGNGFKKALKKAQKTFHQAE